MLRYALVMLSISRLEVFDASEKGIFICNQLIKFSPPLI